MNAGSAKGSGSGDSERRIHGYYENVLSSLIDGVVVVDEEFRIRTFSAGAEQMTGRKADTVLGRDLGRVFEREPEILRLAHRTFRSGRSYSESDFSFHGYLGERRDLGLDASPLRDADGRTTGVVIVFRDLSRIKALEERLRKGERLASLGVLAAGMAHEIKNPLGGIRGAAQLLGEELEPGSPLAAYGEVIIREVDRLNRILQGLLEYSSPRSLRLRPVNLHRILDRVVGLTGLERGEGKIEFLRELDPSLPEVPGDADQLVQVFLNLFKNGIEAMGGRGVLTVATGLAPGYTREAGEGTKKGMVSVEVTDRGRGMEPEETARIFDPFFTRKPGGVGLGLAVSHRIIEEHGGKIEVDSTPGRGTCFRVFLPYRIGPGAGRGDA